MVNGIRKRHLAPDSDTGWDRWELVVNGDRVGELFEHRTWMGSRYGGRRWIAVHNPTLAPYGSLFSTEPQRTMRAAIDLLAAHLAAGTTPGPSLP
jgi:hypothetical protein